jgi:allophanate hydrolase
MWCPHRQIAPHIDHNRLHRFNIFSERFLGNSDAARLYDAAIARLASLGGEIVEVDFAPFAEVAALLFGGPWLVERRSAIDGAIAGRRQMLHPVTRQVVGASDAISAAEVFRGLEQLAALAQQTRPVWRRIDLLLVPTTGTVYRIAEIEADPLALNAKLGRYTNRRNSRLAARLGAPIGGDLRFSVARRRVARGASWVVGSR